MGFERALLATPAGQRYIEQKAAEGRQMAEAAVRETARDAALRTLRLRFNSVPEDVAGQMAAIQEQQRLDGLLDVAVICPDLEAFRRALNPP